MQPAAALAHRIGRIFGIGRLSLVDDTGDQQKAQVRIAVGAPDGVEEVLDGTARVGEYGLASCPPEGAQGLVIYLGGRRSMGLILGTVDRATRMKGLRPGEVALHNGVAAKWIKLRQDGKAEINAETLVGAPLTASALHAGNGASGSFTSQDGKHITVVDGIITSIV